MTQEQSDLIQILKEKGQEHLVGHSDSYYSQLIKAHQAYPGGIGHYIDNARKLLQESQAGVNPYDGYIPSQPEVQDLTSLDAHYEALEQRGLEHINKTAFVLVAGGLGERLGYTGIKLDIPVEVLRETSYIKHYAQCLLALQKRMSSPQPIPFVIMTSEDTNDKTLESLKTNNYYGLDPKQVIIIKQELVPALSDNEAHIALDENNEVVFKPHGHGDVHMLLHTTGTARKLYEQGIEHLVFMQDTNGQIFNAVLGAIGSSLEYDYDYNSMAVNRVPGEAVGGLVKLTKEGHSMTINVEYNQLDGLLKDTISPEGDTPNEHGYSLFPGNINILLIKMKSYVDILDKTGGIIAEFVNPKYKDEKRNAFLKPTRLETMMQDLPKYYDNSHKVGVTIFNREWCFSTDKNNVVDAAKRYASGKPAESACSAESDFYLANRMKAKLAQMHTEEGTEDLMQGIPFVRSARILLFPDFVMTLKEVKDKIKGGKAEPDSTLIIEGQDIILENVVLTKGSALIVKAVEGAKVTIKNKTISNKGYALVKLSDAELKSPDTPEYLKIRGYRFEEQEAERLVFDKPGEYIIE
ncbi:UTP--glucose-1-phosphate uridylyltransferase [Spirochaeta cellobiosiphila]|uniref:UTP--glucose-1-phosphate uridylyltransferase n=1 Tax=Spirochaeta cellobiosiphila TaxID=504483 RepID=UPI00040F14D0|nr:UTP--glucose-1-phosphate uridylyltransferase [Spirochaeta cellobiosiphila]